jgi:hybrid cluster-associated redox disulfide protein
MIIGDILDLNADCAPFFLDMGMHCLGCPSARGETLAEACAVHGVDVSDMTNKINAFLEA